MTTTTPMATAAVEGNQATIGITGYISTDAGETLTAAFAEAQSADKLLISFTEDSFLNSVGIAILLDLILPLKDQGKDLRIVHPSKHFRKVFDIVGLSKDVPVFETEAASAGR
ncbi:STAS domain-containing protein [Candidatus Latescibacterota bacterium]